MGGLWKHRNAARAYVIHIPAKFVSKNGVEDKVGAVTLKKKATRIAVVNDEGALERLLGGQSAGSKRWKS